MDHSERVGDLEEGSHSRKWWCSCDRNPSTCAAHASAAAPPQWLVDGAQRSRDLVRSPEFPINNNSNGTRGDPFLPTNSNFIEDAEVEVAEASQSMGKILKGEILKHPLCDQILAAHIACLRIATPVDHLPSIDAQLLNTPNVIAKYSFLATHEDHSGELDQFMTHFALLLWSFKEHLQQHMRVHVMEAVMACSELEQSLLALTGVSAGEGTGETMTDDDEDVPDEETGGFFDLGPEGSDCGAYGPLIPTEAERTLMERVRQELKVTLKQGYKDRIVDVREEILRKRRAGKLPGNTTTVLKDWWDAHSKWPYPTEDEKARLVQETGLQLKQINNWFINQRKRNWHNNPSSSLRNKRKR